MYLIGFASLCPMCIFLLSNHQLVNFLWTTPPSHSFVFVIPVELPHPNPRQSTSSVLRYHSPKGFYNWFRDGQLCVNLCEREVFFSPCCSEKCEVGVPWAFKFSQSQEMEKGVFLKHLSSLTHSRSLSGFDFMTPENPLLLTSLAPRRGLVNGSSNLACQSKTRFSQHSHRRLTEELFMWPQLWLSSLIDGTKYELCCWAPETISDFLPCCSFL